ncbi:MAG: TonB-dependent receptor [Bacteroidota bacterium]
MLYRKALLLTLWFLFSGITVSAQVSGQLEDSETGSPVVGANIQLLADSTKGTTTNEQGRFRLNISAFPTRFQISAVGYQTRVVTVFEPTADLRVMLVPATLESEPVIVEARRIPVTDIQEQTLPVTSISGEGLEIKSTTTAVDLLRAESGVFIQQTSIGQGSVYVRGRAGRDVLYLFNGLRMNPSFVRSGQNQYFGSIDPFSVQELDVFRGPVSVHYGSDALSGGVNIITEQAKFRKSETQRPWQAEVLGQTNVGGTGEYSAHGELDFRGDKLAIHLSGTIRDFSYYNMSNQTDQSLWFPYHDSKLEDASYQQYAYNLNARWKPDTQSVLSLDSYYNILPDAPRFDRMTMGYSIQSDPTPNSPRLAYFSNTSPMVFSAHSLSYTYQFERNWINEMSIRGAYHQLRDDRKSIGFDVPPSYPDNPLYREEPFALYDNNTSQQILGAIDITMEPHSDFTLRSGIDWGYDLISSNRFYDYHSSNGSLNTVTPLPAAPLNRYPDGSTYTRYGLFTQATYEPLSALMLQVGLRYSLSRADLAFEGRNTVRGYDPYQQSYDQLNGSLGALWKASSQWSVFANMSTGFRAPNVADLAELGSRRSEQFQTANINLLPEKSVNTDAGVRIHSSHVAAELTGFWLHYFDKIKRFPTGRIVDAQGNYLRDGSNITQSDEFVEVIARNATAMNLMGVELKANYDPQSTWKTGATFSYTHGTLINEDDSTQPVDRIPPANGWVWLSYEGISALSIRPQMRYTFAHRRISPDEKDDNRVSVEGTDGFINLQLIAQWKVNPDFTLTIKGDNLTNAAYREHASSLDGLARNVTFTLKMTL